MAHKTSKSYINLQKRFEKSITRDWAMKWKLILKMVSLELYQEANNNL